MLTLTNLQLVAYSARNQAQPLAQIPLTGPLQNTLQVEMTRQLREFCVDVREISFNAGYKPETDERFFITDFNLPDTIEINREGLNTLNNFQASDETLRQLSALLVYATNGTEEVIMIQRFTRSHVIQPGKFLFMEQGTFRSNEAPGLTLSNKPDAVYYPETEKLLFANFRNANGILPLADFYEEASDTTIREILAHDRLLAEDVDALSVNASQWFRTRFSMLRDSHVLDQYTPDQIRSDAAGYLDIQISGTGANQKIVFPSDKTAAKRLLQFLNEELYKGPITDTIYETNSKREADSPQ